MVEVEEVGKEFQYLHVSLTMHRRWKFFFTAIYASPMDVIRATLWSDLSRIAMGMVDPWLVARDFNDIAASSEKKGGRSLILGSAGCFESVLRFAGLLIWVQWDPDLLGAVLSIMEVAESLRA